MSTIESRTASWLPATERQHAPELSRRARFELATLMTAGMASTLFFFLAMGTSLERSVVSSAPVTPIAPAAVADSTPVTSPVVVAAAQPRIRTVRSMPSRTARARVESRMARVSRPEPTVAQVNVDARPAQSRLARFLLGDGSEPVQPFPLASRRSER